MTPWWQNAKVGGSNDRIWRTTMDDMIRQPADLVIIVWSGLNRFEYLNEKNNTWRSAVWVRHRMNKATLKITDDSEVHFHPDMSLEQWKGLQGYASKIRNARYNLITSLNYMISIKYFLEQKEYLTYSTICPMDRYTLQRILNEDRKEGANTVWEVKHIKEKEYYNELPHFKRRSIL